MLANNQWFEAKLMIRGADLKSSYLKALQGEIEQVLNDLISLCARDMANSI